MVYIIEIANWGSPHAYTTSSASLTACRKYIISKMDKNQNSRGIIEKISKDKLNERMSYYHKTNLKIGENFWKDLTVHHAEHVETISWDRTNNAFRTFTHKYPNGSGVVTLIQKDGSIKKITEELKTLNIPSLNAYASITYDSRDKKAEYISISINDSVDFTFTKDGKKCIEIWDVHTGEEIFYEGNEVKDAIKEWYSGMYAKRVLPALKIFMDKRKSWMNGKR